MNQHAGRLIGAADHLRASHIKRWGIVRTADTQTIAEHLYRVWTLVRLWGPAVGLDEVQQRAAEDWALLHDLPEIRTGDAPTPHKTPEIKKWLSQVEAEISPEAHAAEHRIAGTMVGDFCKFCDTAEAILYLRVNGLGQHARDVADLLEEQMIARLADSGLGQPAREELVQSYMLTSDLT